MQFSNSFDVPLPPDQAWATLLDIPSMAPCMPGAELTQVVDADTYKGKVSLRMGPVVLGFVGTARFEARDDAAHTARVKAQGMDAKGRGSAGATVNFRLEPVPIGSKVLIDTDLNLTGAVAQYGRGAGVIQAIAAQLIGQFAANLEQQISQTQAARSASIVDAAPADVDRSAATASTVQPAAAKPAAAKPIGGFSLLLKAAWPSLARLFRA